jgi:hypothetical protein
MTDTAREGSIVLWQQSADEIPGEPALLIEPYSDTIRISQEDNAINLNYESVDEFIKVLRNMKNQSV